MNSLTKTLALFIILVAGACQKMDYNYQEYLEKEKVYSPSIRNLQAESLLKEVILIWDNPPSNVAKTLVIDYEDSVITTTGMIDSIRITNLEIRGYTITVQTRDTFGNLSIPVSTSAFPIGDEF